MVDQVNAPPKVLAFNLTMGTQALKASKSKASNQNKSKEYQPWVSKIKHEFTPLGESLESAMKTLLANKIISLPEIKAFDLEPKPRWWRENDFYDFHCNKGHKTNNYICLKHLIQDKIDEGEIVIDNHKSNNDHTTFTKPFPKHNQGVSITQLNVGA